MVLAWEEFKSAFGPALTRSPKRLAGEAPVGMFPYRGMLISWLLECLLLIALIVLPEHFVSLELPLPPTHPQQDVIYYSGDELPQTQDRGGAQSGKSGRAGGQQAHHHTQTIRVARGDRPRETVVDAPKLNLASLRFRGRQSARASSRIPDRRPPKGCVLLSPRPLPACDEPGRARTGSQCVG